MKPTYTFTVFTPAYNRAHTIHRVYDSLKAQTYRNFEWVVVDDGSVDGTRQLIACWQREADFPITYRFQQNSGKHVAFNRAVEIAQGALFLVIDSDDGFLPESLETMLRWWEDIPPGQRDQFTGVVTLCRLDNGELTGETFPTSPLDTNALELTYRLKIRGEKWGFHRTSILKEFPFPEDPDTRFVPERIVWDRIARKYKIRCINAALRIYYQDSGNQLTKADPRKKARVKNYFLQIVNRDLDYFINDPKTFSRLATLYVRYSLHMGDWGFMSPRRFDHPGAYLLCCLVLMPGMLMYAADHVSLAGSRR